MNWDQIKGDWHQLQGKLKAQFGKLTEDDLKQIDGKREELLGIIQKRYGQTKEEAEKQLNNFVANLKSKVP
jgi:uncharacterized protein YjbJ (UPF0337 family)